MRKRDLSSVTLLVLFLLPVFVQAFDIDRNLVSGEFYAAYRNASAGWRIEGAFSSSDGIEFFICDADNFTKWKRGESVFLYEHSEETTGKTFNFTIPYDSEWYVIFSNAQSQFTTSLGAEIYYINQDDIIQTQVSWIVQSTIVTPLFIGFLAVFGSLCLFGVWISRRSEPFPAVKYDEILEKPK
jgi:hypothetical protein